MGRARLDWCTPSRAQLLRASVVTAMSVTLEKVLENEKEREHFRSFMAERFASEHMDCWCLVQKFKGDGLSDAERFEVASEIFDKFVKDDARHQITIDNPLKDALTRMVENNATIPKMFDTLQQVCFSTMKHSLFPEYLRGAGKKLEYVDGGFS